MQRFFHEREGVGKSGPVPEVPGSAELAVCDAVMAVGQGHENRKQVQQSGCDA